jgi:hypothetical protein
LLLSLQFHWFFPELSLRFSPQRHKDCVSMFDWWSDFPKLMFPWICTPLAMPLFCLLDGD